MNNRIMISNIKTKLLETKNLFEVMSEDVHLMQNIEKAVSLCVNSLKNGGKIIFCGNGGSAAESQHFAAELVSKFNYDRPALAAISLTVDTSILTSIGNDYGYLYSFSRQIEAFGKKEDVLFGLSTSGRSANVIEAFKVARKMGIQTIGLLGAEGRDMGLVSDLQLNIPHAKTPYIQEGQLAVGHLICALIEDEFFAKEYKKDVK